MDDREDKNYVGNEGATKPKGVYLSKIEQRYIKERREVENNRPAQTLINIINFCYDVDAPANNENEKKTRLSTA